MTEIAEAAREGSPARSPHPETIPECAQRARSIALPSPSVLAPVTGRARAAGQAAARAAERAPVLAAEYLDRPGSLVHAQPPTFARAREQHHEAAGRHGAVLLRVLRLAWGYLHLLLVKPVLNGLEWATENPARFTAAAAVALIVWFWS